MYAQIIDERGWKPQLIYAARGQACCLLAGNWRPRYMGHGTCSWFLQLCHFCPINSYIMEQYPMIVQYTGHSPRTFVASGTCTLRHRLLSRVSWWWLWRDLATGHTCSCVPASGLVRITHYYIYIGALQQGIFYMLTRIAAILAAGTNFHCTQDQMAWTLTAQWLPYDN
jgi:hypothetical protein